MNAGYNVYYYIDKFRKIPTENWIVGNYCNELGCCAFGHCGMTDTKLMSFLGEANSLRLLFKEFGMEVPRINDGKDPTYKQPTPKERLLAALEDIKRKKEKLK